MNDSFRVCGIQSVSNLNGESKYFLNLKRPHSGMVLQRFALEQLHDNEALPLVLSNLVNRADVRMVESRSGAGFAPETLQGLTVGSPLLGQELDGDVAS